MARKAHITKELGWLGGRNSFLGTHILGRDWLAGILPEPEQIWAEAGGKIRRRAKGNAPHCSYVPATTLGFFTILSLTLKNVSVR